MALPTGKFWASTQGRLVVLLRGGDLAVKQLAEALGLTGNAVRAHLATLERDGLVGPTGSRRGTRKPNVLYGLTPAGEHLFPRMYGPILRHLLSELKDRVPADTVVDMVRAVGRRMAPDYRAAVAGGAAGHPDRALAVLRDLGGFCDAEAQEGKTLLTCSDCPLGAVVAAHPEVCRLIETLLADVLGVPVQERCQVGEKPKCAFEVRAG